LPLTGDAATEATETDAPPPTATLTKRVGRAQNRRGEPQVTCLSCTGSRPILSWVESMNFNRSVDDDDDECAKAADDRK
jgi:nitric oxide reductase NorD protein